LIKELDYIVVWDHDLAIDPRKIAHEMNVGEEELVDILDNVDVISYMWINECVDRGKMIGTKDFTMELDESKIYRGSRSKETYSRMGGRQGTGNKKRSYQDYQR
jgi:hypothetical protein